MQVSQDLENDAVDLLHNNQNESKFSPSKIILGNMQNLPSIRSSLNSTMINQNDIVKQSKSIERPNLYLRSQLQIKSKPNVINFVIK